MNTAQVLWIGLVGTFGLGGQALAQSTWNVDVNAAPGGDGSIAAPYDSIQTGIAQGTTLAGDTLLVAPGEYLEDIDFLGKDLIVRSTNGAVRTSIVGQAGSVVTVASGESAARLEGMTVDSGTGTMVGPDLLGGGIYVNGAALSVVDCVVLSNTADLGGGVFCLNGALDLQGTEVRDNEAQLDGGGVYVEGSATTISGASRIVNNTARERSGGGLWSGPTGTLVVTNTTFQFNGVQHTFPIGGGGIRCQTPDALFQDCVIRNNGVGTQMSSGTRGGGVLCSAPSARFVRCTIFKNGASGGSGGGFYGSGQLDDCDLIENSAVFGGGLFEPNGATLIVVNSRIIGNSVSPATGECLGTGGGAFRGTYTQCEFDLNRAFVEGGGAFGATLNNCSITNNQGSTNCDQARGGGGISNSTATDCVIQYNRVASTVVDFPTTIGGGGALSSTLVNCQVLDNAVLSGPGFNSAHIANGGGTLDSQLTDCVVARNTIEAFEGLGGKGAGIYGGSATGCQIIDNEATMLAGATGPSLGGGAANATLTRCVLIGNGAEHGAGIWKVVATNCTLTENAAAIDGGGISAAPPKIGGVSVQSSIENCIVWSNSPDQVAMNGGTVTAIYSDVQGGMPGLGNISSDPLFWAVSADDVQLRPGSPCIDAGNPASPPDPDGSVSDMGALPFDSTYSAPPAVYCQAKLNSSGCIPSIGFTGSATLSGPDDFFVSATNMVEQKPTMAIWSMGAADIPFFGGTLCLAPAISRTPITSTGGVGPCAGVGSFHYSHSYLLSQGLAPGDRIFTQFWQRDPAHLDGTGVGLSDGLDFTLLP